VIMHVAQNPTALALDGSMLYFADDTGVQALDTRGDKSTPPAVLSSMRATDLVAANGHVAFAAMAPPPGFSNVVYLCVNTGCVPNPKSIFSAHGTLALAASYRDIFYATPDPGGRVGRCAAPTDGACIANTRVSASGSTRVSAYDNMVYFDFVPEGSDALLGSCAVDAIDCDPSPLMANSRLRLAAADGGFYLFGTFRTNPTFLSQLSFCSLGDCSVGQSTIYMLQTRFGDPQPDLVEVAVDGTNVSWIYIDDTNAKSGRIDTCPRSGCVGGQPVELAAALTGPSHLRSDGKFVYWIDESRQAIMRVAKD